MKNVREKKIERDPETGLVKRVIMSWQGVLCPFIRERDNKPFREDYKKHNRPNFPPSAFKAMRDQAEKIFNELYVPILDQDQIMTEALAINDKVDRYVIARGANPRAKKRNWTETSDLIVRSEYHPLIRPAVSTVAVPSLPLTLPPVAVQL